MTGFPLPPVLIDPLIRKALEEDLGDAGDLTSLATIPANRQAGATLSTRQEGTAAGVDVAARVFALVDPQTELEILKQDGDRLSPGDTLLSVSGPARALLTAERTALNILGHMSGIATAARHLVDLVDGTGAKIAGTRKTLPGLRALQKHALTCGGALTHRYSLADAMMIKDNHIVAAGGIAPALRAAKAARSHTVTIEIEVDTLDQLREVLAEGADLILLDNMDTDQLREAVRLAKGKAVLEASGNVRPETVRAIAETGVDVISSGALTHSVHNLDIGMELQLR